MDIFTVEAVDEYFSVEQGLVMLHCTGDRQVLIALEEYAAVKRMLADARKMPIEDVALVGETLTLNDDGIPIAVQGRAR